MYFLCSFALHGRLYYNLNNNLSQAGYGKISYRLFFCTSRAGFYIYKLESLGELTAMRGAPGRGHLSAEPVCKQTNSPEGPLAVWIPAQLARTVQILLFIPIKHSFRERAFANRTARSRYSVLDVLIDKGDGLCSVADRTICIAHPSTDSGMALMRECLHQNST